MLETLTRDSFEPLIGQKFRLSLDDARTFDFELVDVEALPVARRHRSDAKPKREPFSLFFTAEPLLPQAMYLLQHDAFGKEPLKIFIVPIGKKGSGYEYEAIFT